MRIAVEGCAHGELEKIYETLQTLEKSENIKVDLLLCCGDFQSTRNLDDLQTMAVSPKYRDICTFYKYYSGELIAPVLTIFIGGNHEASNYLQELPYGGWVAPNIYYLGYAGVVNVNGVRIAGLSGIYKGHDYLRGRFEFAPYSEATRISVYHVRQLEVFRLKQLSGDIDIFMSHDWPRNIYNYGNKAQLARFKPHFREEMDNGTLGSRPCEDLLKMLKPNFWFAAHLHCKFAAIVPHDEDDVVDEKEERVTKFLALDKCLPQRRFLQIIEVERPQHNEMPFLAYDLEWLTILYLTNHLTNVKSGKYYLPGPQNAASNERYDFTPTPNEREHVLKKCNLDLRIPNNFCRTVKPFNPATDTSRPGQLMPEPKAQINPQTQEFCDMLGIDDPVSLALIISGHELSYSSSLNDESSATEFNDSAISMLTEQTSLNVSSTSTDASSSFKGSAIRLSLPEVVAEVFDEMETEEKSAVEVGKRENSNVDELEVPESSDEEKVIEEQKGEIEKDKESPTGKLPEEDTEAGASLPPVKKFKRRYLNVCMNANDDDESEVVL